jgi:hypothetical protein
MSTNLTPEQARALRVARIALADLKADPASRSYAYWVGHLQRALQDVTDAFPKDGPS